MKFTNIVKMTQEKLKAVLVDELSAIGYKPLNKPGFLYARGTVPVLLVAHLDTVHKELVKDICFSQDGSIVMSPQGIGGDDRCGVYMILEIIKMQRCHVLFCEDEEIGADGARSFVRSNIKPKVNYIVEIDRRGTNDCVFYNCDNPDFTKFVTGFGFEKEWGSFSDISVIAPHLEIAAVNISAGYHCEHTLYEHVDLNAVKNNIERIARMASAKSDKFQYIERAHKYYEFSRYYNKDGTSTKTVYQWPKDDDDDKEDHILDDIIDPDTTTSMLLMCLREPNYVIDPDRHMIECDGEYFMDEYGRVYLYDGIIDLCVECDGYQAYNVSGFQVKFDEDDAVFCETISEDDAEDYKFRLCYCQ